MTPQELQQKIYLWKAIPNELRNGHTDLFIDALIDRIEELEEEYE